MQLLSYEKDFYGWAKSQANLLKAGKFKEIDMLNIVEELEDLANSNQRQLGSRFEILIAHLLKWQFQPKRQSKSWRLTIKEQRRKIKQLLEKNPSLKSCLTETWLESYEYAVLSAAKETNLKEDNFPKECPYTLEQCLDEGFFPGKQSDAS